MATTQAAASTSGAGANPAPAVSTAFRSQTQPTIKRRTLEELKEGLLRKVAAVKRLSREEGWG